MEEWNFWIDVGGTFTDCLARSPQGESHQLKVLSSATEKGKWQVIEGNRIKDSNRVEPDRFWQDFELRLLDASGNVQFVGQVATSSTGELTLCQPLPERLVQRLNSRTYELACPLPSALFAIRKLLGLPIQEPLPPSTLWLGTTRGTNALLTRSGARVAYLTTRGFGDALAIGDQSRPDLFARAISKPDPLYHSVVEIDERIDPAGKVLIPLQEDEVRTALKELKSQKVDSLAVCLLNAYRHPQHEQKIAAIAESLEFREVSLSHRVAPSIKLVPRGQTTVLDAYLNPVLRSYLSEIEAQLGSQGKLRLMSSTGSIVSPSRFSGKDSILSGPAGGVVGFSRVASQLGFSRSIGLDMGGTSTDVARFDGEFERQFETTKAGVKIVHPILAIETVAAGGGSICRVQDGRLQVGPESAGADPGPACYGRGGPLTLTDINLFLGRMDGSAFPFRLEFDRVLDKLDECRDTLRNSTTANLTREQLALGFYRIAVERMAKAIHRISISRGYDPRDYAMVAFGGASPQLACGVAEELGIESIIVHPLSALLSAFGISHAEPSHHLEIPVGAILNAESLRQLEPKFIQAERDAASALLEQGFRQGTPCFQRFLNLRYAGTDASISITEPADQNYTHAFNEIHQREFGYLQDREIELVSLRVQASIPNPAIPPISQPKKKSPVEPTRWIPALTDKGKVDAAFFELDELNPGEILVGPAVISTPNGTTVVDQGWQASCCSGGPLWLQRDLETAPKRKKYPLRHLLGRIQYCWKYWKTILV